MAASETNMFRLGHRFGVRTRTGEGAAARTRPSPCTHRDVCIEALVEAGLEWRVTFTSASQQGLRSAAKSGLAITVALQDDIQDGLVVAGEGLGLPALPAASFRLMRSAAIRTPAIEALEEQLLRADDRTCSVRALSAAG